MSGPATARFHVYPDQAGEIPALLGFARQDALASPGTEVTIVFAPGQYPDVPSAGVTIVVHDGCTGSVTFRADDNGKLCIEHRGSSPQDEHWEWKP